MKNNGDEQHRGSGGGVPRSKLQHGPRAAQARNLRRRLPPRVHVEGHGVERIDAGVGLVGVVPEGGRRGAQHRKAVCEKSARTV